MLPAPHSSANTRRIARLVVAPGIATVSGSDVASEFTMPHINGAPPLFSEPEHPAVDNASGSNDTRLEPKDPHLGLMPHCLSCTLLTSAGVQEPEDVYGRSMPSSSAVGAVAAALGGVVMPTLHASSTPGASTSIMPAPTEAHSTCGSRPLQQHRWGGNYDSGSQCVSFRGADRSNNVSGCGLRLVGDDVEWLQGSFEDSASSPREEVQLSWRHLQRQPYTGKGSAARAVPPPLHDVREGAAREKVLGAHYRFERAVQPQPQGQGVFLSTEEENSQAAAMLWAAQQMAVFD
ncbi:hypothetical protein, unknown function [Leishmania mexicana MHOM/GT/2001/U1103]|uniref:Uncharacterized protein n=1 Tax=Leishmania mexicana (strain MHOM/GT/2001/U1103) TaxID=929439 RepID=E9ANX7_LEIMU|nr:hypothetical protein, unknown function [Leishmania mexicana MHOM/GT/2001/U1103]CBZ24641.1 hypothetical protein, unknown function [Leishmania mexicana MHOM/GT/2001/U1103]